MPIPLFPFTNFQGCFYFILTRVLPRPTPVFFSSPSRSLPLGEHARAKHSQTQRRRASIHILWFPPGRMRTFPLPSVTPSIRRLCPTAPTVSSSMHSDFCVYARTVATLSALISILVTCPLRRACHVVPAVASFDMLLFISWISQLHCAISLFGSITNTICSINVIEMYRQIPEYVQCKFIAFSWIKHSKKEREIHTKIKK